MSVVEFHNHQAFGDTVVMTCLIRDVAKAISVWEKRLAHSDTSDPMKALIKAQMQRFNDVFGSPLEVRVQTNFMHMWDNNPHISTTGNPVTMPLKIGTGYGTQHSNTSGNHICCAYRESVEQKLGVMIPQGLIKPEIFLSNEEKADREIDPRYWIITTGGRPQFSSKVWPYDRWQKVVDALPHITFVQIGLEEHYHPRLKGTNVIDMVGETEDHEWGIRRLFKLFHHADGTIGLTSAQMHLAGAFEMPCVTIAGAREPTSYEAYNWHQYLHNQGCMVCLKQPDDPNEKLKSYKSAMNSCWRTSIGGCPNKVKMEFEGKTHEFARCIEMVTVEDVVNGVMCYYRGGMLDPIVAAVKPITVPVMYSEQPKVKIVEPFVADAPLPEKPSQTTIESTPAPIPIPAKITEAVVVGGNKPIFKLICNATSWGGGERSPAWILKTMAQMGWRAQLVPKVPSRVNGEMMQALAGTGVEISNKITEPCEVLMMYSNDMVFNFDKPKFQIFEKVQAKRKIMVLNYKGGKASTHPLFNNWDSYIFLSSDLRDGFLKKNPNANTAVLAPPVDLEPFLNGSPGNLNRTLHMVRVSTQPERKYPKNTMEMMDDIREIHPNVKFSFMAAPNWVTTGSPGVDILRQGEIPVPRFLERGNIFWYPLPENYTDQGPRVIVEALAFGLPVIGDNRDGAKDRIIDEVGWRVNSHAEYLEVLKSINGKILNEKGQAAKEYARQTFDPMHWISHIVT